MAAGHDAQQAGERVEALLAELGSQAGPQVAATAEELVSCLVELYGAGLAEIVRIIGEDAEENGTGQRLMDKLAADPLVESLLLLHDLHPLGVADRVRRAIGQVMPQLGAQAGQVAFARRRRGGRHPPAAGARRPRLSVLLGSGRGGPRTGGGRGGAGGIRRRRRSGHRGPRTAAAADHPAPDGGPGDPVTKPGRGASGARRPGLTARFVKRPAGLPADGSPAVGPGGPGGAGRRAGRR